MNDLYKVDIKFAASLEKCLPFETRSQKDIVYSTVDGRMPRQRDRERERQKKRYCTVH